MGNQKQSFLMNLPTFVFAHRLFEAVSFKPNVVMLLAVLLSANAYGQTQTGTDSLTQDATRASQTLSLQADSLRQPASTRLTGGESKIQQAQYRTDTTLQKPGIEHQATRQLSTGENKIREKTGQLEEKVTEVKPVRDTQDALGNIQQETGLSGPNGAVPEVPGVDASEMGLPDSPSLPNTHLPTDKLSEVKTLPSQEMDKLKSIEGSRPS